MAARKAGALWMPTTGKEETLARRWPDKQTCASKCATSLMTLRRMVGIMPLSWKSKESIYKFPSFFFKSINHPNNKDCGWLDEWYILWWKLSKLSWRWWRKWFPFPLPFPWWNLLTKSAILPLIIDFFTLVLKNFFVFTHLQLTPTLLTKMSYSIQVVNP